MDDVVKTLLRKTQNVQQKVWGDVRKFGDEVKFWLLMEKFYGYALPGRDLSSLVTFFIMTYLAKQTIRLNCLMIGSIMSAIKPLMSLCKWING